jgi:hypothetical protein
MKMTAFSNIVPYSQAGDRAFKGAYCLRRQSNALIINVVSASETPAYFYGTTQSTMSQKAIILTQQL